MQVHGTTRFGSDPLQAVMRALILCARSAGFQEVALGNGLVDDDDGDFRLDVEEALSADGLLPVVAERARAIFSAARLNATHEFPIEVQEDSASLIGKRVGWQPSGNAAGLGVTIACMCDAFNQIIKDNPTPSVLTMAAT